jgi:hypothetical protein
MDLLAALESMAELSINTADAYISANTGRWMKLFNLTQEQAERAIEAHLSNLSRRTVSNEQWALLSGTPEARNHDQESYAYHISNLSKTKKKKMVPNPQKKYLLKLEYPLDTIEKLCEAVNLLQKPETAVDEEGTSVFAIIDATTRAAIEARFQSFDLTFVDISRRPAEKALSASSIAPTLGTDATLPQHRIDSTPEPAQDQYPVPYFFYGMLADGPKLAALLDLDKSPTFEPAVLRRGKLRAWRQYRALVDGEERDTVDGWMYVVRNREDEDALRNYEGGNYEVIRCEILVGERAEMVEGLTFRFCGDEEMLR